MFCDRGIQLKFTYRNRAINSRQCNPNGKRDSLSHLYSSVSWESTNFESPKISTASAPASRSNSIPLRIASYSATLLVQRVDNLMEKENVAPRGDTSKMPMPQPSSQTDPSKNIAHAFMDSDKVDHADERLQLFLCSGWLHCSHCLLTLQADLNPAFMDQETQELTGRYPEGTLLWIHPQAELSCSVQDAL